MGAFLASLTPVRRPALAILLAAAIVWPAAPAAARGPEAIADVAEQVIDAVVNISTKQTVEMGDTAMPQLPPGSPFEQFFEDYFKNHRKNGENPTPRRINSLGSGFIIDPAGSLVCCRSRGSGRPSGCRNR